MENEKRLIDINKFPLLPSRLDGDMSEYERGYLDAQENMNLLPTVDAVEVVHGRWIDGGAIHNGKEVYKSIDCSVCEEYFKVESQDREYWKERFKVCPFCGAKMDGDSCEID